MRILNCKINSAQGGTFSKSAEKNTGCFFNWCQSIRSGAPQNIINFEVIAMGTCTSVLRIFGGGTSWHLQILGGHQFESSKYFTYRTTLRTFRGPPVKKSTLYSNFFSFSEGLSYVQIGQGIQNLGPLEIVEQCRGHWCTRGSKGAPGGSRVPLAPKRVIKQQNNGPKPWFKVPSVSRGIWVH